MSIHVHDLKSDTLAKLDLGFLTAVAKKETISSIIHKVWEGGKVYLEGDNILDSEAWGWRSSIIC